MNAPPAAPPFTTTSASARAVVGWIALASVVLAIGGQSVANVSRLRLPAPSGPSPIGRERVAWVDDSRPETNTASARDRREVIAEIWFPARPSTGRDGPYITRLPQVAKAMIDSGEVSRVEALGLRHVRENARTGAGLADASGTHPVVFLSPGNATNVQFYSSLAEDLASHGYVVVGIDHPFASTAVELDDGTVAAYRPRSGATTRDARDEARVVAERVADMRFALDRITDGSPSWLRDRLDLSKIGIMGHSVGGMTAMEACKADARFRACVNIDGQQAGGALSVSEDGRGPNQPFMVLTKERLTHPVIERRFETADRAYRVVVPAADHSSFSDAALFRPRWNPLDRTPDKIITVTRSFALAFFEKELDGGRAFGTGFSSVPAGLDVYVNVYPLGGKPPLPAVPAAGPPRPSGID